MDKIKKNITALLFIGSAFFINNTKAQSYELGAFGGLNLYKGEISNLPNPLNYGVNGQVITRYNIDHQSTIRINLAESIYTAKDKNNTDNLSKTRNSNISGSIGEASFIYEYNFYQYRNDKIRIRTTPYLLAGLGFIGYTSSGGKELRTGSLFNPVIPFGIGTKTVLTKNLNLNIEFASRKTFTDHLDNTHDEVNGIQNGFKETFDWYSFMSVGITYTFYPILCPVNQ